MPLAPLKAFRTLTRQSSNFALLIAAGFALTATLSACVPKDSTAQSMAQPSTQASTQAANNASSTQGTQSNVVRIGYQKYGSLFILKARRNLEQRFKSQGISVQWIQFPAGPPLLEALNTGSLDYGSTGETPPIFAQAAGAPLVYVANESPDPRGEAILVPKGSPLQKVQDLKGKKVAFTKASNVHYLVVQALESAGLKYSDIQPVYLPPADARAAFVQGSVDAWAIWVPYLTVAKHDLDARVLKDGVGLVANRQFYLAAKPFAEQHPDEVKAIIEETQKTDDWTKSHQIEAATLLSPQIGIPAPILTEVLKDRSYKVQQPLQPDAIAYQQQVADKFLKLGLLPKSISVKDVTQVPK